MAMADARVRCAAVVLLLCIASGVAADPAPAPAPTVVDKPTQLLSPSTITTDGGSVLRAPPGRFVPEPAWSELDTEMKRLQDVETRLTAENNSFRATAASWQPGWYTLLGTLATGIAAGIYLDRKL